MDFVHLSAGLLLIILLLTNLKFTIMKLLMTVQPKNGEKPSDPVIVDTDKNSLCCLADDFLRAGDKVLIFQPVAEYAADPCGECDKKNSFSFFSSDIAYH